MRDNDKQEMPVHVARFVAITSVVGALVFGAFFAYHLTDMLPLENQSIALRGLVVVGVLAVLLMLDYLTLNRLRLGILCPNCGEPFFGHVWDMFKRPGACQACHGIYDAKFDGKSR